MGAALSPKPSPSAHGILSRLNAENHYLTIDYFASQAGFDDFMREFRQEYDALDLRGNGVLEYEKEIGAFAALGSSVFRAGS